MINAEIITIGDEILIGQVVDTNSAFIGQELTKIGIEVRQIKTINDDRQDILDALKAASENARIVLITGGLGPTKDDITKMALADYFGDTLVEDPEAAAHVKRLFEKRKGAVLQINIDQAKIPSKATALKNKFGTAPGMWFDENEVVYISLPGVPYEMKGLMADEVIPRLQEKFQRPFILYRTALVYGLAESVLADKIADWEDALPQNIHLAYLPSPGMVRLRLTARGDKEETLKIALDSQLRALDQLLGNSIGGYENEATLQETITKKLILSHKTLATVESCTGGKIANLFTEIPGASAYFKGCLVPYFTSVKSDVLGIPADKIEEHSVVSGEVAEEMARRGQTLFKADMVLATTGNAGPAKGDSDAEIGTVFIALAYGDKVDVQEFNFGNLREKVVGRAVFKSMEILKSRLD